MQLELCSNIFFKVIQKNTFQILLLSDSEGACIDLKLFSLCIPALTQPASISARFHTGVIPLSSSGLSSVTLPAVSPSELAARFCQIVDKSCRVLRVVHPCFNPYSPLRLFFGLHPESVHHSFPNLHSILHFLPHHESAPQPKPALRPVDTSQLKCKNQEQILLISTQSDIHTFGPDGKYINIKAIKYSCFSLKNISSDCSC